MAKNKKYKLPRYEEGTVPPQTDENSGGNLAYINMGSKAAGQLGATMGNKKTKSSETEQYVDTAQSAIASAIPMAALFHGISEGVQGLAGSDSDMGKALGYAFEPHTLITNNIKAYGGSTQPQYNAEGGEVVEGGNPMAFNGMLDSLSSSASMIEGASHANGGVDMSGGKYIYSDKLKHPVLKKTFAELAEKTHKTLGKAEKNYLKNPNQFSKATYELTKSKADKELAELKTLNDVVKAQVEGVSNSVTPMMANGGRNFKSASAYKAWLAYGHTSGEFAKTPGHQKVSIQGKSKNVKHMQTGGPNEELEIDYTINPETGVPFGSNRMGVGEMPLMTAEDTSIDPIMANETLGYSNIDYKTPTILPKSVSTPNKSNELNTKSSFTPYDLYKSPEPNEDKFNYKDLIPYAGTAANLLAGAFGKANKHSAIGADYSKALNYKLDTSIGRRDIKESISTTARKLRETAPNASSYLAGMTALGTAKAKELADLDLNARQQEMQYLAPMYARAAENKQVAQKEARALDLAAKANKAQFVPKALGDASSIYQQQQRDKLLMKNMAMKDYIFVDGQWVHKNDYNR